MEIGSVSVNPKLSRLVRAMNPNQGRVLITLALMVSGMVGVVVALTQSPRSALLFQEPPAKTEPVAATKPVTTTQPVQQSPPSSRSQEIATQLDQSLAGQLLKQLSQQADTKVQGSKTAIDRFIQQKTDEQRESLKQLVIEALQQTAAGEVKKQSQAFSNEFKGIQLTPAQSAQIQQARRDMQTAMVQQLQSNPELLKQVQSDRETGNLDRALSQPLNGYNQVVTQVLTPQQREQWQKNFKALQSLDR